MATWRRVRRRVRRSIRGPRAWSCRVGAQDPTDVLDHAALERDGMGEEEGVEFAARQFARQALATLKVTRVGVVTDAAPVYLRVLYELVPSAWRHVERHANNPSSHRDGCPLIESVHTSDPIYRLTASASIFDTRVSDHLPLRYSMDWRRHGSMSSPLSTRPANLGFAGVRRSWCRSLRSWRALL